MILDDLSDAEAATRLRVCCGSHRWVEGMLAARPFSTPAAALAQAERIWQSLGPEDWLEAFAHHPRIGEKKAAVEQDVTGAALSAQEQSRMSDADAETKAMIASLNDRYEERFGFIYIVCAAGKSATELLALLIQRMNNAPDAELLIAAEEQRKIMKLRLAKLLETT